MTTGLLKAALLLGAFPLVLGAQAAPASTKPVGRCQFEIEQLPQTSFTTFKLPSGQYNSWLGRGLIARCRKQGLILRADSLEQYGDEGRFFFIGHVDYYDPRLKLKSDYLTYFQREERLLAFSNVDATLPNGSKMKGPSLEYFRPIPKVRPQQRAVAVSHPTMSIIDKDAQGKPQPPVTITGETIWLVSDSIVSSQGGVVVVRPELTATGDSIYLDGGKGTLRIMRSPRINGTKGRPFTLIGETIDLLSRKRKLERVMALNAAQATSEDINLKSDTIDLRISDDQLQRAISWGKTRARATSPAQTIVADSIDVAMPGQRIREMRAIRGASAEATPDTSRFKTTERDRLMGDTVIATFDTVAVKDTAAKPHVRNLLALGNASSLQHLAPQDTACHLPIINYVRGTRINVTFKAGKPNEVTVLEKDPKQQGGILAEPDPTCGKISADSAAKMKSTVPRPAAPGQTPPSSPPAVPPTGVPPRKP